VLGMGLRNPVLALSLAAQVARRPQTYPSRGCDLIHLFSCFEVEASVWGSWPGSKSPISYERAPPGVQTRFPSPPEAEGN
jgi:hypothetical protein